ncbi:MAG: hypothetical protein DRH32_03905 [Deltaproteobacteria bacterium]|nr:MAG: hypothetical protein DRH32_03905 [Deltaproteobacteria bacterium]
MGDCHYLDGNVQAERKIAMTRKLLDLCGIGKDRLHLYWVSSAEAQRFAETADKVTECVRALGRFDPSGFDLELEAAMRTLDGETVRWTVGKQVGLIREGDVYGRKWDPERLESVLDAVLEREYYKNLICRAIEQGHASVREISTRIGVDLQKVSYVLTDMEKTGMVEFRDMVDRKPVFAVL